MSNEENRSGALGLSGTGLSRAGMVVLLSSVAAMVEVVQRPSLGTYGVWVHLRLGSLILANKAWPTAGLRLP